MAALSCLQKLQQLLVEPSSRQEPLSRIKCSGVICHICFCLQDKFFAQLKSSANGFSVIADFFGRGLLDAASISTARPAM